MKKLLYAAALAAVTAPSLSQGAVPVQADPAMWVVKDADTTIYLFGTFHMLDGKQDWFNDEVKEAFEASDELVLEALIPEDPAKLQPLIVKYAVDPAGRTLSSKLPAILKTKLEARLTALGVPMSSFEPLEPWFVSMTVTSLALQKAGATGEHGPEKILAAAARTAGKPVGELEGLEFQLGILDRLPEEQQIAQIGQTLESIDRIDEQLTPMITAWAQGDTETLLRIMNEGLEKTPWLVKTMFTDRNAAWARWVDARLDRPGTVMVAVGAGHLAGKDSVQAMLKARGLSAERVQ